MRRQDSLQWSLTATQRLHQYTPLSRCAYFDLVPAIIAREMCSISLSSLADCNAANECSSGGARLFFCNRMADDQVAASGGKEDLKRGRTRGTPGSPSRTEEDTLTDFATSVFRGRFSYRGFCLTLMAFRINKETLAGEIFQLARAYKDGGPPN